MTARREAVIATACTGALTSGAALVGVARKALQQFNEEQERATGTSTSLVDAIKKLMPPYDYERIGVQR